VKNTHLKHKIKEKQIHQCWFLSFIKKTCSEKNICLRSKFICYEIIEEFDKNNFHLKHG
jgi:hypothetical protein